MSDFWSKNPGKLDEAKALWLEGHSAAQVASLMGGVCSRSAVLGKMYRLGLTGKKTLADRPRATPRPSQPKLAQQRKVTVPRDEPPALTIGGAPITFLNAETNHCRYPHGDPCKDDFHLCGRPKFEDRPYCTYHCSIAYTGTPTPPSRRPKSKSSSKDASEPDLTETIGEAA